jgi:regulator of protease activity HflC (stomatin/prohibitin superfamily)
MLSESPRFNAARRYGWALLIIGTAFAVSALVLFLLTWARAGNAGPTRLVLPRALGYLGAALCATCAAFLSSALLSLGRQRHRAVQIAAREPAATPIKPADAGIRAAPPNWRSVRDWFESHLVSRITDPESIARWPPPLAAMLFAALALLGVIALWRAPVQPGIDPLTLKIYAAVLIVAAFPLLVLERVYANMSAQLLPEAPQLERLSRLPLAACLALSIELVLRSIDLPWAFQIEHAVGVLVGVVSLEIVLRCAVIFFVPFAAIEQRLSLADSGFAAAVLRLRPPSLRGINIAVRRQLGIDLSRSWALAFIQRAALPVLLGIGLLGWAITGVTTLGISERGIYERFGVPVAVFGPGVHVHLPWPVGTIRPVEIGVVHLLPIEFVLPGAAEAGKSSSVGIEQRVPGGAEASAPEQADRLWTDDHPFEGSYIIASSEHGSQSFQLVNIDMAVIYRVGLSEQAARDSAYRISNIDELIQAISGQLLVRYFSHNTLLDLLGSSRESFTQQFQSSLQGQLDRLGSGVEAIAVSVEAIHPPPGAASSYHGVQAAQIRANTQISIRRGDATRSVMVAQQSATEDRNAASAAQAERVGQAQADSVLFTGDRQAYAQDGYAFLLERWLANLTQSLAPARLLLLDYRLNPQSMPALDLRNVRGLASDTAPPAASSNSPSSSYVPSSSYAPSSSSYAPPSSYGQNPSAAPPTGSSVPPFQSAAPEMPSGPVPSEATDEN